MVTSIPFRLCTRAPRMTMFSCAIGSSSFRLQLDDHVPELGGPLELQFPRRFLHFLFELADQLAALLFAHAAHIQGFSVGSLLLRHLGGQIGRASCRERV